MNGYKKMKRGISLVMVAVILLITACKKGDTGAAGPAGAIGATGAQGIPGTNGSKFYSGSGAPATGLGTISDMYLDVAAAQLYGPKTDAGWGNPINLKGADGAAGSNGASGNKILAGNGVPAAGTGANGDFYMDLSTAYLYGPKAAAGWGTPVDLKGPAGVNGSQILSGNGVPAANVGAFGDYYLDKSTAQLYGPKTANGWGNPVNLKGADGTPGTPGQPGKDGARFYSGSGAPAADLGAIGDMYMDVTNAKLYGPKTANGWGVPVDLKGPQGEPGTPGSNAGIQTFVFHGPVSSIAGNSSVYVFAGPTATVTITSKIQTLTGSASAPLGFATGASPATARIEMCYQRIDLAGQPIVGFNGAYYATHRLIAERRTYSVNGSISNLEPGTYKVGMAVLNGAPATISDNDYVNGWVMLY